MGCQHPAALVSPVEGASPLLKPATVAQFGQIQISGIDLVLRQPKAWAAGFHASSEIYPVLAAGAFGHSGAGGQQALIDPRNELSYAFLRRRFLFPTQADPDHGRLLRALVAAARQAGKAPSYRTRPYASAIEV